MRLSTKETRLNIASAASAPTGLATSMQILNRFLFRVTGRFLAGIYLFTSTIQTPEQCVKSVQCQ